MATLSNYALRLHTSLMDELRAVVEEEGTTINQFINVAVAEKLAALRTERFFQERAARADPADFLAILAKAGTTTSIEGDELPETGYPSWMLSRPLECEMSPLHKCQN